MTASPNDPPPMTEPLVLRVDEAARLLRVSRSAAYRAVAAGQIPTVRIGRRLLVPRHAVDRLLGTIPSDQAA